MAKAKKKGKRTMMGRKAQTAPQAMMDAQDAMMEAGYPAMMKGKPAGKGKGR